jgi:hypothetical protein
MFSDSPGKILISRVEVGWDRCKQEVETGTGKRLGNNLGRDSAIKDICSMKETQRKEEKQCASSVLVFMKKIRTFTHHQILHLKLRIDFPMYLSLDQDAQTCIQLGII